MRTQKTRSKEDKCAAEFFFEQVAVVRTSHGKGGGQEGEAREEGKRKGSQKIHQILQEEINEEVGFIKKIIVK